MKRFCRHRQRKEKPHSSSVINYNSFTFTDSVTNNTILLKQAKEQYHHHSQPSASPTIKTQNQINNLENCISLLKTTKLFQMQALRNKLFKSAHHSRQTSQLQQDLTQTKYGLKTMIDQSIQALNRKELQQWLVDPQKRINPHVMSLHSLPSHKYTRQHLLRVLHNPTSIVQPQQLMPVPPSEQSIVQIPQQKELLEKIQHCLTGIRAHNSYLVRPDTQHELYEKLYTACRKTKQKLKKTKRPSTRLKGQDKQGVFRPIKAGQKVDDLQKRLFSKQRKQQSQDEKELIYAVQNNLFFDMELLLNSNKSLAYCSDKKGNTLLHIAAKTRNRQFFQFIFKRTGPVALTAKNNLGKTPLDLAKLYGVSEIVTFIENCPPIF